MNVHALFGLSALMSLLASAIGAKVFLWPHLRGTNRNASLLALVAPHMFLRFIGLSFLVPGVVSPTLPSTFAIPAAYGDFVAGILAILATLSLARRLILSIVLVWVFNAWGAADLLLAAYQGLHVQIDPGALGAAFFIPTAIVPPLLVTHALIFWLLVRPGQNKVPTQK